LIFSFQKKRINKLNTKFLCLHKVEYIHVQIFKEIMVKFIALYRKPQNVKEFDEHYDSIHTPLVLKMPGLRKLEITRISGAPIGDSKYYLHAEMYFDSIDAMNASNASPEGRATAKDLMSFASDLVTLFYGEVEEK